MKRRICSTCGTVQPADGKFCVSCGAKLDDVASDDIGPDYFDSKFYFSRKKWMNIAVLAALVAAVGNVVVMCIFGHTHYVWIPFICAVIFGFTALIFAFPTFSYKVLCHVLAHRRYSLRRFSERLPDDIDDPYPKSIRQMFIAFTVLSAIALLGCLWFLFNIPSFVIPFQTDIFSSIDFG